VDGGDDGDLLSPTASQPASPFQSPDAAAPAAAPETPTAAGASAPEQHKVRPPEDEALAGSPASLKTDKVDSLQVQRVGLTRTRFSHCRPWCERCCAVPQMWCASLQLLLRQVQRQLIQNKQ
jgi:hypothetical protein